MSDKIESHHLRRRAVIYLRQSTMKQVVQHGESTRRQYALKSRAAALGWTDSAVTIVDEDLGRSGSSATWRTGFTQLAEDVAHDRVGAIFALEVSRLARSSADWHRLLDLCRLADVLIVDEQRVYAPSDYGDRLLLGFQGTMSEAEQYWMRLRLEGGRLSKAKRGAFRLRPPAGYVWDDQQRGFRLDPDEAVVRAVSMVFERFRIDGSARAVTQYFARAGLKLPVHDIATHELKWQRPRYPQILGILHHPIYAGAYVFGRSEEQTRLVDGQLKRRHKRTLEPKDWKVCLKDQHPAYIRWEEFVANQRMIDNNCTTKNSRPRGAPRDGEALLGGILLCGRCGRPMQVSYPEGRRVVYTCSLVQPDRPPCWTVAGRAIDRAVADVFLQAIQPTDIELSLALVNETRRQSEQIDKQWQLQLERARYEARVCERRYKAVDPDNRVVARSLERDWEQSLRRVEQLERSHEQQRQALHLELTAADRQKIQALSRDLPALWHAPSTKARQRKHLLRMLVQQVTISPIEVPARSTRIQILWQTGAVNELTIARPSKINVNRTSDQALDLIRTLCEQQVPDHEIAQRLNDLDLRTGRGRRWTVAAVRRHRYSNGWHRRGTHTPEGLHSVYDVAETIGVSVGVVRYWTRKGWIHPAAGGGTPGAPLGFKLDPAMLAQLRSLKEQRNRNAGLPASSGDLP